MLEPFVGETYNSKGDYANPKERNYCEEDDPGFVDGPRSTLY